MLCLLVASNNCDQPAQLGAYSLRDPKFVMLFLQHSLEPLSIARSFHADSGRSRKRGIKLLGFSVLMFQPTLNYPAGCRIQDGYLLEARMEII